MNKLGSSTTSDLTKDMTSYSEYLKNKALSYQKELVYLSNKVISDLKLSDDIRNYLFDSNVVVKYTKDGGEMVETQSSYNTFYFQMPFHMNQLITKPLSFFASNFESDESYEYIIRNFMKGIRNESKNTKSKFIMIIEEFIDDYFMMISLLNYIKLFGTAFWLFSIGIATLLIFLDFTSIVKSMYLCQDHEILERIKYLDKVYAFCETQQSENFFYLPKIRENDLVVQSIEERGAYKAAVYRQNKQHYFGLFRSSILQAGIPLVILILMAFNISQLTSAQTSLKTFSSKTTSLMETYESNIEHSTMILQLFLFSNSLVHPLDKQNTNLLHELNKGFDQITDKLFSNTLRISSPPYFDEPSIDSFMISLTSGNLCEFLPKLKSYNVACKLLDKKVASEGYLQAFYRYRDQISSMKNYAAKNSNLTELNSFINEQGFVEHEYMSEIIYNEVYIELMKKIIEGSNVFVSELVFSTSSILEIIINVLIYFQFLPFILVIRGVHLTYKRILFLYQLVPMRSVLENMSILNIFLRIYKKKRQYFS